MRKATKAWAQGVARGAAQQAESEDSASLPVGNVYEVEAEAASPYFGGPMEITMRAEGICFRWHGEQAWSEPVRWHELAYAAGCKNEMLREELKLMREEGFNAGLEDATKECRQWAINRRREMHLER